MKHLFTLLFVSLLFSNVLLAKKVEVKDAQKAAETYINQLDHLTKKPSSINLVYTAGEFNSPFAIEKLNSIPFYYVFNFENRDGFIIMSADDAVSPVLAYSTQKNYRKENQPDAFVKWMDKYRREISEIIKKEMPAGAEIENQWERLQAGLPLISDQKGETKNPLMNSTWDQMQYYHDQCPYDDDYNERVATGCVATAMAQIMKYHNHPQNGEGYHTYNHSKYGSLSANFGSETYNWSSMPNNVTSSNAEVAKLMYHCGVSLEMNYGPAAQGGSSTNSLDVVANALKSYFSYSNTTQFVMRQSYSDANWKNLLKDEINNNRPMEYAGVGQGGGHAFVCDGYDASDMFHFNWGWSGYYDGYFNIDNLNPGTSGTGSGASNYNQYQQIVYGIQPEEGSGGGGGGGTPPGEGSPLFLYSSINVSPAIDFFSAFSVSLDIANTSGSTFTGDLAAAIFNSDGANVAVVETKTNVSLENNYYYSLEFATEGLPVTPGNYTIGIYSRANGAEWAAVKDGDYSNGVSITINGPQNDIQLYSSVSMNPDPIIQGEALVINVDIANVGSFYTGTVSADIYTSEGEYAELVQEHEVVYQNNYYYETTFEASSVNLDPGTYIIAFWEKASSGSWQLIGSTNEFPNPVTVKIVAPSIQGDPYENNDTEANAYVFNTENGGYITTTGSNTHIGTDYDYYEFDLDPNFKYEIEARVHDSYNSGNGQSYTNDVIFSYNEGNGAGEGYDHTLASNILVNGKNSIKFFVSPYFAGQTGTYLLDVNIIKKGPAGIEDMLARAGINIYPNPASDLLHLEVENFRDLNIIEAEIYNAYGQNVQFIDLNSLVSETTEIDISSLESGVYFLRIKDEEGMLTHKFNVLR